MKFWKIDERFRPELLITVGYTDEKLEPSYRLPVELKSSRNVDIVMFTI